MIYLKILIKEGQYMSDIMHSILSNKIYFKKLTGIRATTLEIDTPRHSIIIEPNVPVIRGKKKSPFSKGKFLGVHEGIYTEDIMLYMNNKKNLHKKIMVTPESFSKVIRAAEELQINIYEDYFLLFDECDRTMKDVEFRKRIIEPIDDFFKFKNKAFISATAVVPSDPSFLEQGFEQIIIEPDYDYSKDIDVIISNNVSISLKEVIEFNSDKTICIFLNSIQAITMAIEDMQIKSVCNIYCSKEKMYQLKTNGYSAFETIGDKFAKINFFTSRFNSAVDILMEENPVVILATNLYIASHTMIDPRSEAVQIVGRFRNGVNKIYAISNYDEGLRYRTQEETLSFLEGCEDSYQTIKTLHDSTNNEGAKITLAEALELVTYSNFIKEDGTKNYFMIDNLLYEESVKKIFQSKEEFASAYHNQYFNPTIIEHHYQISDADYKVAKSGVSIRALVGIISDAINKVQLNRLVYQIDNRDIVLKELEKCFPLIYEAFFILGEEELRKNSWSKKNIKDAIRLKIMGEEKRNFAFIDNLNCAFEDGYKAPTSVLKATLKRFILKHSLSLNPTIELLKEYFVLSPRTTVSQNPEIKGYRIIRSKFNRKKDTK